MDATIEAPFKVKNVKLHCSFTFFISFFFFFLAALPTPERLSP
jgi:hypothetical protein